MENIEQLLELLQVKQPVKSICPQRDLEVIWFPKIISSSNVKSYYCNMSGYDNCKGCIGDNKY